MKLSPMKIRNISIAILGILPFLVRGQASEKYNPNVKEIIVICKTHFDIGFTHRVKDIVNYYQTDMIDNAFKAMDASGDLPKEQQFAWTLPGWVLSKTMEDWDGQNPERKKKLEEKYRSGQIISHALPFTITSDICGLEEMVRGLGFSSALSRKYNLPLSRSGKLTDEPSHTGALATVLANAGVKFLHIGCNWPSGFVKTPGLFWWEGPDGSRVLTLYSPIYGTSYGLYPEAWTSPDDPMIGKNLIPAKDWPYKVWPAILVTGDNSGPPTGEQIKAMFEEIKAKMPGVDVHMGTMDDFYDAMMQENPVLPVVKSAMPDTWVHGVMCDPGGVRLSREVRSLISSAEALNTQLKCWGVEMPSVSKEVANAYEKIALYGEHTWGGSKAISAYGEAFRKLPTEEYKDLEASWEDKTDYIRDASEITQAIATSDLACLAKNVRRNSTSYVVYNPLPWVRSGLVKVGNRVMFVKDIPSCGYRTIPVDNPDESMHESKSASIENEFFKITFDPEKGAVSSWLDKQTGREWIDKNASHGFGQYLNERFTFEQTLDYTMTYQQGRAKDWPHPGMHKPGMISEKEVSYRAASPKNGQLKVTANSLVQTAELQMPSDRSAHLPATVLRVSLYKGQPYVDMEITIQDKEKDNWPEADWLCLPFKIKNPEFNVYRQLGVMNPATDIQRGANRHLYAAEHGLTITGPDGAGIAVCPLDHPLVSLGVPGCWKYSDDYVPEKPVVYLNLYNNQWNTNFRYWYPGTWSSRVRLWTIDNSTSGNARNQNFITRTLEAHNPLLAAVAEKNGGTLSPVQSGIELSRPGVIVTAFGEDPDGNAGTLLRVWEQAGISGKLTVTLPKGMNVSVAELVNLRGEKTGKYISIDSGKLELELGAYAPVSFILK